MTLTSELPAQAWADLRAGRMHWRDFFTRYGMLPPIMGADDDPPADDPPTDPVDDPPADDPPADDPPTDPTDPPADPPVDGISKAEAEALRRRLAESERAKRKADAALKAAQERERKRQGEFESLYEEEKTKREQLEGVVKKRALKAAIRDRAGQANFRDATDAVTHIFPALEGRADDIIDDDLEVDEHEIDTAIKNLAKAKPYLVKVTKPQKDDDPPNKRRSGGGGPPAPSGDDKSAWNPAATMRDAYAASSG